MSLAILRRHAVAYAAGLIEAGTDYQEIEWNLLNLERFAPLISSFDAEDLYDEVSLILSAADDEVEDKKLRNAERAAEYSNQYPELDDVMKRER